MHTQRLVISMCSMSDQKKKPWFVLDITRKKRHFGMCLDCELRGCLNRGCKYVCCESSNQEKRQIETLRESTMHQAKWESRRLSFLTVTQIAIQMLERLESNSWRRSGHAPPPRYSKATHEQTSKSFHPTWLKVLHSVTGSEQS